MSDNENTDIANEEEETPETEETKESSEDSKSPEESETRPSEESEKAKDRSDLETKNGEVEDGNRRKLLVGAGIGAVAVAAAAYGASKLMEAPEATEIRSKFISDELPLENPTSPLWKKAPAGRIVMDAQNVSLPMKSKPAVKDIKVRSLNNGDSIGFLLEWGDPSDSNTTIQTDKFRDACAVLFVADPTIDALRMMGAGPIPATIIQWKADWQVDVEKGFQDLETVWPNTTFDFYPPLKEPKDHKKVVVPDDYVSANAAYRIAGFAANNPVALMDRKTPVEKVIARGPGTAATFDTQDAIGWGVFRSGGWKVALGKSMKPTNQDEVPIPTSGEIGVAFAIWRGDEGDRGARKSPSKRLIKLIVESS